MRARSCMKSRRGAVMVLLAAGITMLVGMGSLVCDVGLAFAQRTRMQMAADAAALAAARHLAGAPGSVRDEAVAVARLNGSSIAPEAVAIDAANHEVTVAWKERTGFVLAPVFERLGVDVHVSSTARMEAAPPDDAPPVVPFLVREETPPEVITTIKYGPCDMPGNFGAGAIDGVGANVYKTTIVKGAKTTVSAGMFVYTETGDMVGPTDQGVASRIGSDATPYEAAKAGTKTPRLVTVPLVRGSDFDDLNGRKPIMVRGTARFYLIGSSGGAVTARRLPEQPGGQGGGQVASGGIKVRLVN